MKIGISYSTNSNSWQAAEEAVDKAVKSSGQPALTFLFTTDSYHQKKVFESVKKIVGESKLIGFCCGGIITDQNVLKQGIGVCTLSGNRLKAASSLQLGASKNPYQAGKLAGEELLASGISKGTVFIFPDGFGINIPDVVRGIYDAMGPDFKYAGAGAGDNLRYFKTYQFTDEGMASDALACAVLDGVILNTALGHGWKPLGEPVIIGNTEGKKVIEIDGSPAFMAYQERFGSITADNFSAFAMKHPIGFPNISGQYLIRDPLSINTDQSISFVTEVPNNAVGYVMDGTLKDLLDTAADLGKKARGNLKQLQFILCLDCISRYLLMEENFIKEIDIIKTAIGRQVPMLGALSLGEIGCYEDVPLFHNKALSLVVGDRK